MKLCRFQPLEFSSGPAGRLLGESHPVGRPGIVEGDAVHELAGRILDEPARTGRMWPLDEIRFLPPAVPTKIVCVGRNYREHAAELANTVPKEPLIFLKPPSAILAPDEPIILPPESQRVDFEGELAVIISRCCSRLTGSDDTSAFILGYTCLNDVTARDLQKLDVQFTRAKGFDTFCPFGPLLETQMLETGATVETFVNGVRKQSGHTREMMFSVDAIIRWISQVMTLEPGDVIATGTPSGVGPLAAGDVVEVSISGIGTLSNPVAAFEAE